ncbi:MAG: hypothetical protein ACLUVG_20465 [Phocaeicola vulgatus]
MQDILANWATAISEQDMESMVYYRYTRVSNGPMEISRITRINPREAYDSTYHYHYTLTEINKIYPYLSL